MKKTIDCILLFCLLCCGFAHAQTITPASKVYIDNMSGFGVYLTAAFQKKQVPLAVTTDKAQADYIVSGTSEDQKAGWAKMLIMGSIHSADSASVTISDVKTNAVVFAYAVNKSSSYHGQQSTAEACAKHLKAHMAGKE